MGWWHNEPDYQQHEYWTIFSGIFRSLHRNRQFKLIISVAVWLLDVCREILFHQYQYSPVTSVLAPFWGQFWSSDIVIACVCVCICVPLCVRVCQPRACMRDYLPPVQARLPIIFTEIHIAFLGGVWGYCGLGGWVDYANYMTSKLLCKPLKVLVFKLQANWSKN